MLTLKKSRYSFYISLAIDRKIFPPYFINGTVKKVVDRYVREIEKKYGMEITVNIGKGNEN